MSSSFEKRLDKYLKADTRWKEHKTIVGKTISREQLQKKANECVSDFLNLLRNHIIYFKSRATGEAFLNDLVHDVNITPEGAIINIGFNENTMYREPMGSGNYRKSFDGRDDVYLPALLNNTWSADPLRNGIIHGYDRHGNYVRSSNKYMDEKYKGFVYDIVNEFNVMYAEEGIVASYNEDIYDVK